MTTRAQLESEREALAYVADLVPADCESAVRASIARVEALLSMDDEVANNIAGMQSASADYHSREGRKAAAHAHRTVANLIRREPRGDV